MFGGSHRLNEIINGPTRGGQPMNRLEPSRGAAVEALWTTVGIQSILLFLLLRPRPSCSSSMYNQGSHYLGHAEIAPVLKNPMEPSTKESEWQLDCSALHVLKFSVVKEAKCMSS